MRIRRLAGSSQPRRIVDSHISHSPTAAMRAAWPNSSGAGLVPFSRATTRQQRDSPGRFSATGAAASCSRPSARTSRSRSGRRCSNWAHRGRPATASSRQRSAARAQAARSARPWAQTRSPGSFPAIAYCAATAGSAAITGVLSASARSWRGSMPRTCAAPNRGTEGTHPFSSQCGEGESRLSAEGARPLRGRSGIGAVRLHGLVARLIRRARLAGWHQHLEHALLHPVPHLHVLARELGHGVHGRWRAGHHLRDLLLDAFLLADEGGHALLQVTGHEVLHRPAVVADDRLEQLGGEDRLAKLLLLGDDLQEDQAGDVFAGLVLDDLDLFASHDEVTDVLERHVLADRGIVKPPIGVLLDEPFLGHVASLPQSKKKGRRPEGTPSRGGRVESGQAAFLAPFADSETVWADSETVWSNHFVSWAWCSEENLIRSCERWVARSANCVDNSI